MDIKSLQKSDHYLQNQESQKTLEDVKEHTLNKEQISNIISESFLVAKNIVSIVQERAQTNNYILILDKEIEKAQEITKLEINKMMVETENWEKRLDKLVGVLKDLTELSSNLHPEVAKSMFDVVKSMINSTSAKY